MTSDAAAGVSVVVICLNEVGYIDGCLNAIGELENRAGWPIEIVVVDGGSVDGTVDVVSRWARVHKGLVPLVIRVTDRPGYGYQRNAGVEASSMPWIAFISADVLLPETWLDEIAIKLSVGIDAVVGRVDLVPAFGMQTWEPCVAPMIYRSWSLMPDVERCSTVHFVARRTTLLRHRFDEQLDACEDKDLAFRLQVAGSRSNHATCAPRPIHLCRDSFASYSRKVFREARALARLQCRHGTGFPDCFGWRRSTAVLVFGAIATGIATVSIVLQSSLVVGVLSGTVLAAILMLAVGLWRAPANARRVHGRGLGIVVRWAVLMLVVALGQISGGALRMRRDANGLPQR